MNRRCALCHKEGPLANSHLMPAALFKLIRGTGAPGESADLNPIHMTTDAIWQTSRQFTGHLLCPECEDRLSRLGERYACDMALRGPNDFPLGAFLEETPPAYSDEDGAIYAVGDLPELDSEKLLYFAASVFWRAAARRWTVSQTKSVHLQLGTYAESLRRFLLQETGFPDSMAIHLFVDRKWSAQAISTPAGGRDGPYHTHAFIVPGMQFDMSVGKQLPERERSVRLGPQGVLFYMDLDQGALFRNTARAMGSARVSRGLAALDGERCAT